MPYISQLAIERCPYLNTVGNDYDTPDGTSVRDYIHVVDLAAVYATSNKSTEVLGWKTELVLANMCLDAWNWQAPQRI